MTYDISELFKSVQGEGVHTGTPMAFIRFSGCSVGKKVCNLCDTDFERMHGFRGGGTYSDGELARWAAPYRHVCLTGGEPLDQDLEPLFEELRSRENPKIHIETSGTVHVSDLPDDIWLTVSPKPGWDPRMTTKADEIKVLVPGLGGSDVKGRPGWPTIHNALSWAHNGKIVYLQPVNSKHGIDKANLRYALQMVSEYPELRLSVQTHKLLEVL